MSEQTESTTLDEAAAALDGAPEPTPTGSQTDPVHASDLDLVDSLTADQAAELLGEIEGESEADAAGQPTADDGGEPEQQERPPALQSEEARLATASWWEQNRPSALQNFHAKWEGVNWNELSARDPATYGAALERFKYERGLLEQADNLLAGEIQAHQQRAETEHAERVKIEHQKIERAFPEHFKGKQADKTYANLGAWLVQQGVPAERVASTWEAPIIAIAMKAFLADQRAAEQGQRTARTSRSAETPSATLRRAQRKGESLGIEEAANILTALKI